MIIKSEKRDEFGRPKGLLISWHGWTTFIWTFTRPGAIFRRYDDILGVRIYCLFLFGFEFSYARTLMKLRKYSNDRYNPPSGLEHIGDCPYVGERECRTKTVGNGSGLSNADQ